MPKSENFTDITEEFLKEIVEEVRGNANVDVKTKVDVLKEMTRWAQVKNKIAPEGAEGSKIDEYRNALKAGSPASGGRKRRESQLAGDGARAKIDKIEKYENRAKAPEGKGYRTVGTSGEDAGRISGNGFGVVSPGRPVSVDIGKLDTSDIVSAVSKPGKSGTFGGI